jgi:hypothetical protein
MAGLYPDPPGARMAYDADGSSCVIIDGVGAITVLTNLQAKALNDESGATKVLLRPTGGGGIRMGVVFSQPRDLKGLFFTGHPEGGLGTRSWNWESSVDTTSGVDGTWVSRGALLTPEPPVNPTYRSGIAVVNVPNTQGIRITEGGGSGDIYVDAIHIYAPLSASASIERLTFWHPTLSQPITDFPGYLDWGNRPRGSTDTRTIRVKNLSAALTASTIQVGVEALTDATPTMVSQHQFKYGDGGSYASTITIPSLAPGQVSDIITIQQTLADTAVLGLWAQRYFANAGLWA